MAHFIFLDTETTAIEGRIIELAFLDVFKTTEGQQFRKDQDYCNPGKNNPIEFGAMAVHNITPEMIEWQKPLDESSSLANLIHLNDPENYLIAHNSPFDLKMLEKDDFYCHMKVIDTLRVCKHILPDEAQKKLQYLRYSLGLYKTEDEMFKRFDEPKDAHSALPDCIFLYMLFEYLVKLERLSLAKMVELTNTIPMEKIMYFGKYKGETLESIAKKDMGYLQWCIGNKADLSEEMRFTMDYWIKEIPRQKKDEFDTRKLKREAEKASKYKKEF